MAGRDERADAAGRARAYYRALDEHDYDHLRDLLAPGFVQERPDMTLDGRDRFVQFVREERPQRDTTHAVDAVYVPDHDGSVGDGPTDDGPAGGNSSESGDDSPDTGDGSPEPDEGVAVRGRLLSADDELIVRFVDVFTVGESGFERLETFTR